MTKERARGIALRAANSTVNKYDFNSDDQYNMYWEKVFRETMSKLTRKRR